jgi:hypothetical protein
LISVFQQRGSSFFSASLAEAGYVLSQSNNNAIKIITNLSCGLW